MNNPYIHRRKSDIPSQRTFSLTKKQTCSTISQATINMGTPSLNHDFLMARRQNYLNTGYNNRRKKLKDITSENIKIYMKINSQKSAYSRDELRKSYESNASLSRRLSQSKISKRSSSSRSSQRSSQVRRPNKLKTVEAYKIETNSIASMNNKQLQKIKSIFKKDLQNCNPRSASCLNGKQIQTQVLKKNPKIDEQDLKNSIKLKLPPIRKPNVAKLPTAPKKYRDGQFLHIIAQQMFGRPRNKC